jgi:hypothetical protein
MVLDIVVGSWSDRIVEAGVWSGLLINNDKKAQKKREREKITHTQIKPLTSKSNVRP